jgi:hypothetical protein
MRRKLQLVYAIILNLYGILKHFLVNYVIRKFQFGINLSINVKSAQNSILFSIIQLINVWKKIALLVKNGILRK